MFEYYYDGSEGMNGYDYGSIDTYYEEVINIFPKTASDISKPQVIKPTTTNVVSTLEPSVTKGGPSTVIAPAVKQNFEIFPYQILDNNNIGTQPSCNSLDSKCVKKGYPEKFTNSRENFAMYPVNRVQSQINGLNDNTMIIIMFIILLFFIMYQKIKIENLKFMLKCLAREKYNKPPTQL
jgi:hypothetical protein